VEQPAPTILVIDPDAASRNYLSSVLQKGGYTVLLAPSGREGLITAWKDIPGAIIFDPALGDMTALALVTRLRQDRRTAHLPLVALSGRENQQESSQLLSAGCNEYMLKSTPTLNKLLDLLPHLQAKDLTPMKTGVLITFLSAKGGTGTSSLCANMAMCLGSKKLESRVAVADLVLPIGSIANIVGYDEPLNLVTMTKDVPEHALAAQFREKLPRMTKWYFNLLAGSPDPETANHLTFDRIEKLIAAIQESYDFVFIDLGRSLSRLSLPILQRANLIVLIVSTELASVVLTQAVCGYLKNQGVDEHRIYPILNRAVGLEGLTKAEAEQTLGLSIRTTIPYMGSNFTLANNRHEPVLTKFPEDSFALSIAQATTAMVEAAQRPRA
jgi:Flp pilus assembly CpaE family ATPase